MYSAYNEGPLNKKFICNYCDKAFRTRQGLSGHIQWGHGAKQQPEQIDEVYIMSKMGSVGVWGGVWGLSESAIEARQKILADWLEVQGLCDFLNINLNAQDFKYYLIARLAQLQEKGT